LSTICARSEGVYDTPTRRSAPSMSPTSNTSASLSLGWPAGPTVFYR
jgi:hypothetical protein